MSRTAAARRVTIQDLPFSIKCNGTNTAVTLDAAATTSFGTGDFSSGIRFYVSGSASNASFNVLYSGYTADVSGQRGYIFAFNYVTGAVSAYIDSGSPTITSATGLLQKDAWNTLHLDRSGANATLYLNGVSVGTASGLGSAVATSSAAGKIGIHPAASTTFSFNGFWCDFFAFSRTLSANEAASLHYDGVRSISQTGLVVRYRAANGTGTAVTDESGNGHTGVLANGTWSLLSPFKPRQPIGGSLIRNWDFELVPTFTAATATAGRWIDGTSGGSTSNDLFAWAVEGINSAGTFTARYDTTVFSGGAASLKISTTAAASAVSASTVRSVGTASLVLTGGIPCLPNTTYTMTYRMKTLANSGAATTGAYAFLRTYTNAGASLATVEGTKIQTTTDWMDYTITITTGATAAFLVPMLRVVGNDGAGTLIMDAWFDSIVLRPAFLPSRQAINGNMIVNGDFAYAPTLVAPTTTAGRWIDGTAAGSTTVSETRWATLSGAVTAAASASLETRAGRNTMKLDLTNTSGAIGVGNTLSSSAPASKDVLIPLLPSTSYTLSFYLETLNCATNAAFAFLREFTATLASTPATNTTSKLSGTNARTLVTMTFTTNASTYFGVIALLNNVAGNVSTAWFDSVTLTPTTPVGRSAA